MKKRRVVSGFAGKRNSARRRQTFFFRTNGKLRRRFGKRPSKVPGFAGISELRTSSERLFHRGNGEPSDDRNEADRADRAVGPISDSRADKVSAARERVPPTASVAAGDASGEASGVVSHEDLDAMFLDAAKSDVAELVEAEMMRMGLDGNDPPPPQADVSPLSPIELKSMEPDELPFVEQPHFPISIDQLEAPKGDAQIGDGVPRASDRGRLDEGGAF